MEQNRNDSSYDKISNKCNEANRILRKNKRDLIDKHIHEIKPIIFGGNPNDLSNKIFVSRYEHAKLVTWWNKKLKELKKGMDI